jgi:hypothetical protein
MIEMLIQRTQPTIITKVKAHANIVGNEHTDKLAKDGNKLPDESPVHPYEKAHPTPYYFHRDNWPSIEQTPDKGPISHFHPYIKNTKKNTLLKQLPGNSPTLINGPVIQT